MNKEIKNNIDKSQKFLKQKDFINAEKILFNNLKISQNNFETFFLLGTISAVNKKLDKAEIYLKKAILLNPSHANSILNLAIILKKMNKKNECIIYFNKLIELDKKNIEGFCGLAQIFEEEGNYIEAENYFKKALDIDSNHHVANHSYGKLLLKLNQHKNGLRLIEKVSGIIKFRKNTFEIV